MSEPQTDSMKAMQQALEKAQADFRGRQIARDYGEQCADTDGLARDHAEIAHLRAMVGMLEREILRLEGWLGGGSHERLSVGWETLPDVTAPQPRPFPARALRQPPRPAIHTLGVMPWLA